MESKFISNAVEETFEIGKKLSEQLKPGDVVLVEGSLGAGKSVLIRGLAYGLGVEEDLPSPTFTLVNEYNAKFKIYHFDLYRVNDPYELYEIGFEDYVYSKAVSFIEWPSKAGDLIPEDSIFININLNGEERVITVEWKK